MLLKFTHTLMVLHSKFWGYNPYFESNNPYLIGASQETLKQFSILCDFIRVLVSTTEIEVKENLLYFRGKKYEDLNLHKLSKILEETNDNELLLAKCLLSKIKPLVIEQLLVKLDLNLLKSIYESR